MGELDRQKWMASISKALEELKRGNDFMPAEASSRPPASTGSATDREEERADG